MESLKSSYIKAQLKDLNKDGNAETLKGEVAFQTRDALQSIAKSGNGVTRSNTKWRRCEYIFIELREKESVSTQVCFDGWKALAYSHGDQTLILEEKSGEWSIYDYKSERIGGNDEVLSLIEKIKSENLPHTSEATSIKVLQHPTTLSRQLIYFGAPGTSKSTTIKRETEGKEVHRVTFHPDTDYASFVGCYKPTKAEDGTLTYDFTQQAFVTAYVSAWTKLMGQKTATIQQERRSIKMADQEGGAIFTITAIDNQKVTTKKDMVFPKDEIGYTWNNIWSTGSFKLEGKWQKPIQWAICRWIFEHVDKCTIDSLEEGWAKLLNELQENGSIMVSLTDSSKQYEVSYETEDAVHVLSTDNSNQRTTIAKNYDASNITATSVITVLQLLLKERDAENFDHAWEMLCQEFNAPSVLEQKVELSPAEKEVFLVIEEINRGNCAQIFGDLFQLLDRRYDGYSDYQIEPDRDLQRCLEKAFKGLSFPEQYAEVQVGKKMCLPPNLYIWATMNTSDQSLFPIDSAFKRRWDWRYLPITEGLNKDTKQPLKWYIHVKDDSQKIDVRFDWYDFLKAVNTRIENLTESEDKQLGYFFCQAADDKSISLDKFVGKVVFYLWNDIFKDFVGDPTSPFTLKKGDNTYDNIRFRAFFDELGNPKAELVKLFIENMDIKPLAEGTHAEPLTEIEPEVEPVVPEEEDNTLF